MMKTLNVKPMVWAVMIVWVAAMGAVAQTPPAATQAPRAATPEELQRSMQILQQRINLQQQYLTDLRTKMLALDDSIEKRVDQLLKQLESVKDSVDSKTRLGHLKAGIIEGLRNSITFYKNERNKRVSSMVQNYAGLTQEQLQQDVKKLDERSEKRVDQIGKLASTLTGHKGYQQYETFWDNSGAFRVESDRYRHNRQEESNTVKTQRQLVDGARKTIEDLKRQNATLEAAIPYKRGEEEKQFLRTQIQHNNELMDNLRNRVQSLINSSDSGARELGQREAFQLEQLVNEMVTALKRDFNSFRAMIYERDNGRMRLNTLEAEKVRLQSMIGPPAAPASK